MSDGIARNLRIIGNTLSTQGQHYISLLGFLEGWIEGNIKPDESYTPILLDSVRLAGEQNVYILSFQDSRYRLARNIHSDSLSLKQLALNIGKLIYID
jgi:hypothetical protein